MADEPKNLIFECLRRFDRRFSDIGAKINRILDDVRMPPVEEGILGIQCRIDRGDERVWRRLALTQSALQG